MNGNITFKCFQIFLGVKKILSERIEKFFQKICDESGKTLREDGWFFGLLLFFNLSAFLELFTKNPDSFDRIIFFTKIFLTGAIQIFVFCVAFRYIFSRLPKVKFFLQVLISIYCAIIFVTEIFLIYQFQTIIRQATIDIILGTNPFTVKEFFGDYILKPKVFAGIIAGVLMIFLTAKFSKKFFAAVTFPKIFGDKTKFIQYILIVVAFFFIAFRWQNWIALCESNGMLNPSTPIFKSVVPLRVTVSFVYYLRRVPVGSEETIFAEMDKLNETEKILENNSTLPYIVFVIGESADRNYMSLYGYKLETTPNLDRRFRDGEIARFTDTIACGNFTAITMSKIGTFAEKDDELNDWYRKANLFDIMKRAGYYTVWISNQSHIGILSNFDHYFAERCNEKFFTDIFYGKRGLDEWLLPPLDEYMKNLHEKNFYIIHLTGQHPDYGARYTPEFAKFKAEDIDKPEEEWRRKTAEYANATLYNDYILEEIIKRFEDKNAVMIYISDHGQEVYEGRNFGGHSLEPFGSVHMIEIPTLVWASKKFRETYPEKFSLMKAAEDKPYRNDYLIHAILDLADIHTTSYDPTKSIWNKNFDSTRPRIYNDKPYTKN